MNDLGNPTPLILFSLANLAAATALNSTPRPGPTVDSDDLYDGTCTRERFQTRKEWRNLDRAQQQAYLDAVQCLIDLPADTGMEHTTSRWSDLQALHRFFTETERGGIIHNVGQFLPWHRYFLHVHETLLRDECGYEGPVAWWNEQSDADAGDLLWSPMWNADNMGGNGTGMQGCVVDGAFADLVEYIGPFDNNTERCLDRRWDSAWAIRNVNSTITGQCFDLPTYTPFWQCVAYYPHKGCIRRLAGCYVLSFVWGLGLRWDLRFDFNELGLMRIDVMADVKPGDPMFFIHHAFIDRLWYTWQMVDPDTRLFEISGNSINRTDLPMPVDGSPETTLDYELESYDILPNVTVEDVMNPVSGYLCYEYD
ncbi:uncharacterized protein BO97DRAFT_462029 [Aspergillus homomorphus CBS 101889]|uniref:Tyrosinase copper-binding domain-containing protein n=1 Tax=Aspergillus homomorphus (strain CBS 101889) TaxID=1450537 RepID=A0A395HJP7_ASPHC|nr:hypothetical protein BO97DRAFT_462029 [Aspergillus homomorphus CBS 101889]RAL08047.1 hypothetical protein BO97DRAFT_462029 [Aspergillus homomorphus CBS 101889]